MASYTGRLLPVSFQLVVPMTALPDGVSADYSIGLIVDEPFLTGAKTHHDPTNIPPDSFNGLLLPDYGLLWFNRIHVIPYRIDLGNLVSSQIRQIEIFNAYFEQRTILSVTPTDLSGVAFDITTPVDIPAINSIFRNLTIDTVGAISFTGFYDIEADDAHYFLFITGSRVLVIPFQHNWTDKILERLAWSNASSGKSLNGFEQLIQLRGNPRRSLTYQILLASSHTNAARLRALFAALIAGWQTRIFAVPIWTDATRLTVQADAGQDTVQVNTQFFDYDIGSYVMLWQNEETYELVEILEVNPTNIKATVNLANTWAAGRTVVMPARLAYINANIQGVKHTVDIDDVPVSFEFLPEQPSTNRLQYETPVLYRGKPVLLTKNNYDSTRSFMLEQSVIRNDADTGRFTIEADQPTPDMSTDLSLLLGNHQQVANYFGWLDGRKGRIGVFWLPTWSKDIELMQDITAASAALAIKYIGYTSLYQVDGNPAYNRRDLMILLRNGTRYFRRITAASDGLDGTETLALDTVLGIDIPRSAIDRVCFLIPSALKADAIDIQWTSGDVSQSVLQISDVYDNTI